MQGKINFVYILNGKIPTNKAHGVQVVYTCNALSDIDDLNVELVSMKVRKLNGKIFDFYSIKKGKFKHTEILSLPLFRANTLFFSLQRLFFTIFSFIYLYKKYKKNVVIFTRDEIICSLAVFLGFRAFLEVHDIRKNFLFKYALKNSEQVISVSNGLQEDLNKIFNIYPSVIRNSVLDSDFPKFEKSVFKQSIKLAESKKIVTYTGSLDIYDWKGVDLFLEASKILGEYMFLCVGGTFDTVEEIKKRYQNSNLILLSHVPHIDIQKYQLISDLLLVPNKKGSLLSEKYTCPIKIFEYMKTGIPIVCSDLPSIREIVEDSEVTFFEANSVVDLVNKIQLVFGNYDTALKKAIIAKDKVKKFSYRNRAQDIYVLLK